LHGIVAGLRIVVAADVQIRVAGAAPGLDTQPGGAVRNPDRLVVVADTGRGGAAGSLAAAGQYIGVAACEIGRALRRRRRGRAAPAHAGPHVGVRVRRRGIDGDIVITAGRRMGDVGRLAVARPGGLDVVVGRRRPGAAADVQIGIAGAAAGLDMQARGAGGHVDVEPVRVTAAAGGQVTALAVVAQHALVRVGAFADVRRVVATIRRIVATIRRRGGTAAGAGVAVARIEACEPRVPVGIVRILDRGKPAGVVAVV